MGRGGGSGGGYMSLFHLEFLLTGVLRGVDGAGWN